MACAHDLCLVRMTRSLYEHCIPPGSASPRAEKAVAHDCLTPVSESRLPARLPH